jgi:hypothetical protein
MRSIYSLRLNNPYNNAHQHRASSVLSEFARFLVLLRPGLPLRGRLFLLRGLALLLRSSPITH